MLIQKYTHPHTSIRKTWKQNCICCIIIIILIIAEKIEEINKTNRVNEQA